ncbi:zinc-binding dehydrogenase [Streptomyces sp. NPDC001389]|uniref:zinc-binding dehydrogenase n=1 Tax=Streptomyces sp. NPDC001389 TaxID=3364569 RepID=UPI0036BA1D5D
MIRITLIFTLVRRPAASRFVEFGFTPCGAGLESVSALVEDGSLRVAVDRVLPPADAATAHALGETGHVEGRIVLAP